MPLKTPKFWHKRWSIMSILLLPASWLYRLGHRLNMMVQDKPYKASIPIICIGNAIAGGSGKTPSVITLIKLIKDSNLAENPMILTRGYGGDIQKPTLVNLGTDTAQDVGDEALILANHAPVIVARNRAEGAKFATNKGADLLLMDDGLQNNHLHKDIKFLVVDRQIDFGNNRVMPAGPLREPLRDILKRIDGIICIGRPFQSDLPVFESHIQPQAQLDLDRSYIAFAGLGYPEKFKNTLLDLDANLIAWHPFPDHHPYTETELEDLYDSALNSHAKLITTEKDFKRLTPEWQEKISYLPIALEFADNRKVLIFIKDKLAEIK